MNLLKVKARQLELSFYKFLVEFWPTIIAEEFVDNWHIKELCNELQVLCERLAQGLPLENDLVINVPPGTSKTTITTIMLPAWLWTIYPQARILTVSYSSTLAIDHSTKSRDVIRSDKYRLLWPEVQLRGDFDNKSHFKNTANGERYTTSTGGTVTGFHAHLILVDDPLNPKKANSEVERDNANEFMSGTLATRKVNKASTPTVLIMQRLHEKDPSGVMIEQATRGKKVKVIRLPAELTPNVEPAYMADYYQGGLMDPIRMSRPVLDSLKISLGEYNYAGQMLQEPAPLEGGIVKAEYFKTFKATDLPPLINVGTDWDLAFTAKTQNSASAYVTAGIYEGKAYVIDIGFKNLEFPELINYMKLRRAPHYIEAKASGKSAVQTLVNMGVPASESKKANADKVASMMAVTPFVEAGRVVVREDLLQTLLYIKDQGLLLFPNNAHDDLADAFSQSIARLLLQHQGFTF